jgi:hypothetical protein
MGSEAERAWARPTRAMPVIFCLLVVALSTAHAEQSPGSEIAGRWETANRDFVVDISRCGEGYCGQLVKSDGQCMGRVLLVALKRTPPHFPNLTFSGELALPERPPALKVTIDLTTATATSVAKMLIVGDVVEPSLIRRTFPFRELLARVGDGSCAPRTTS